MKELAPQAVALVERARQEAYRYRHYFSEPEHVLLAIIGMENCIAHKTLAAMGLNLPVVAAEVTKDWPEQRVSKKTQEYYLVRPALENYRKLLVFAEEEARAFNHGEVDTEHLLLAITRMPQCRAFKILDNLAIDTERTRVEVLKVLEQAGFVGTP